MQPLHITSEQAMLGLRAMKVVALANGIFARKERELLEAAAQALGLGDVGEINGVAPDELAAALPDPTARLRLVQAMMVMALIDGEPSAEETREIDRFAQALGVDDPRIGALHAIMDDHLEGLRREQLRRDGSPWAGPHPHAVRSPAGGGPPSARVDPATAARYARLAELPEGSFGRAYAEYLSAQGWDAGSSLALSERAAIHGLTHVLSGYDTSPEGEAELAAFTAGFHRTDPFAIIFASLVVLQLSEGGELLAPATRRSRIHPRALVHAFERGLAASTDFLDAWDPWPLMDLPLDEVRARLTIAP